MNDIQHEILKEIKGLAVQQATLSAKLDSHLENQERLEDEVDKLKIETKIVAKHDLIIKAALWVYGIIISALIYNFFSGKSS